ncbi:hypothetical protein NDU88_008068 [Pleurodeles waltl]|uniref:Uncharacterized protein n=1 Tax=Pleurodeles waltl TaxID=8319 RepID=A0AAV7PN31_PLEWA|nr:hypothetical protein NDU88_008068 [Pleurodeles waltl]
MQAFAACLCKPVKKSKRSPEPVSLLYPPFPRLHGRACGSRKSEADRARLPAGQERLKQALEACRGEGNRRQAARTRQPRESANAPELVLWDMELVRGMADFADKAAWMRADFSTIGRLYEPECLLHLKS